jgi:competence protein ComEA
MRHGFLTIAAAGLAVIAADAAIGQSAAPTTPTAPAAPTASPLPAGPGHDTMVRVCSACHAPEIAAQQRLSRQGWSDLVNQMASQGATASDEEFDQIIDYLARSFPDKASGGAPASK